MALHEIRPGLRVINKSNAVAKITIHVAAGDELEVSQDVADQIAAASQAFAPAEPEIYKKVKPYPPVEEAPADDAPAAEVAPRPRKRTPRKS